MMTSTTTTTARASGTAVRIVLTFIGAAAMIVGVFMAWTGSRAGADLSWKAFISTSFDASHTFLTSVGAVFIALALLGLLGLAASSGWLTRLAGALGIVGFALVAVEIYRAHNQTLLSDGLGIGAWVALIGSLVLLIAGFFGTPTVSVASPATPVGE